MIYDMTELTLVPIYCLIAVVLIAAVTDLFVHRIPNLLLAPALAIALIIGASMDGIFGVLSVSGGLAVGIAMLLPLYVLRAMGAGDVKLLGVAGAFLGPEGALIAGMLTFMAGAILGLGFIGWRAIRPTLAIHGIGYAHAAGSPSAVSDHGRVGSRDRTFAYAPAIATGTLATLWIMDWPFALIFG